MIESNLSAQQILERQFGISGARCMKLGGEVAQNYRVELTSGERRLLKIFPANYSIEQLAFEADLLAHLATKGLPFTIPQLIGATTKLPDGRRARLQTWVPGRPLGEHQPIDAGVREDWGRTAGLLNEALADYAGIALPTDYVWNPLQTLDCRKYASLFTEEQRDLADYFWGRIEQALPQLNKLPKQLNYNDAHGENFLVDADGRITGVIDFGDALYTARLCELAIACAYAGMNVPDPVGAFVDVVRGYATAAPVAHVEHLYDLIAARLLITVSLAAERAQSRPGNDYLQVSARPAWALLRTLRLGGGTTPLPWHPAAAHSYFAAAAKQEFTHPAALAYRQFTPRPDCSPVALRGKKCHLLNLSVGSLELGGNPNFENLDRFTRHLRRTLEDAGADFAYGGYHETRPVYTTDAFVSAGNAGPRWRTVHLGLDVWGPAGTPIVAPLPGRIHSTYIDPAPGSYGPTIILEHDLPGGQVFYTLYGHLAVADVERIRALTQVQSGDQIATFGAPHENGGWPPHLHFQVMIDMLGLEGDFPGVAFPEELAAMSALCPDPYTFFPSLTPPPAPGDTDLATRRKRHLGRSLSLSYDRPLHIVRGYRHYLYDADGQRYLDTVNNVAHVGHEHPAVVEAIQRQAAVLNTNSRYLHENLVAFAEELSATFPPELSVVHFVNSGSEATELALRMCAAWSGTRNVLAIEAGYHGNTGRAIDVSAYKFDGTGGRGAPPTTDLLPLPDTFRGPHRTGAAYAAHAHELLAGRANRSERIGGFIAESILSCGGQIPLPAGYLAEVYAAVRGQGGLCIADEVQTGLGRVGSHWWAFERQGVVPDIVTIGKPIGNGHPLGAVVCTPAVADRFANGMEYFNTFGGNPVSCAAGRAVLRVVQADGLRENAAAMGTRLEAGLRELQTQFPIIGDVRGAGLFLGVELVEADGTPATARARWVKERLRGRGILSSTDGPAENVLKIKPPLCIDGNGVDWFLAGLEVVLGWS